MFVDLYGWEKWNGREEGTEIRFELDKLPFLLHKVSSANFTLFATPAVNVFDHQAEPTTIENRAAKYPVRPSGLKSERNQIYSLMQVSGRARFSTQTKIYSKTDLSVKPTDIEPRYEVIRRKSALHSGMDDFVSLNEHPGSSGLPDEVLYIDFLCTNGRSPETLQPGDVCNQTSSSPNFATFTNFKQVNRAVSSALESNQLWRLLAICSINLGHLTINSLWAILELISETFNRDHATAMLHAITVNPTFCRTD